LNRILTVNYDRLGVMKKSIELRADLWASR
jgi:hypothetical protein